MKFIASEFSYFVQDPTTRRNLDALKKYLYLLIGIITLYSIIFHLLMVYEGQDHSWLTGLYWTLTVMSTLGFGDITFTSDLGRLFSVLVLASGIVLLLVMLPFAFIRFFYAPWLEAQIRAKVSRKLPDEVTDHVIICQRDSITNRLIQKLELNQIPYCIIEEDPALAAQMREEGLKVVAGDIIDPATFEAVNITQARAVLANAEDTRNTGIILTVRSLNEKVPIIAIAEEMDSIDIFALSGATYLLPLKLKLGESLATRISAGVGTAHEVGRFKDLVIVEFLVHDTPLAGMTLREAKIRETTGMNVVGMWECGHLVSVDPNKPLSDTTVPVAIGNREQVQQLNQLLGQRDNREHQVLVIGGGKVGCSTARKLKMRGVHVRILDHNPALREELEQYCDQVIIGKATDAKTLAEAGINEVSAIALTTHDDAQNIHLSVFFRRMHPQLSIVSRLTRVRNIEAIYRAGSDFVLSYASLGCEFVNAYLLNREPVMVGEGADFFSVKLPKDLKGKMLLDSGIGKETGMVVIAIEDGDTTITNPPAKTRLEAGTRLVMLGTNAQREKFNKVYSS
ncbi:MAG: NAD-binding protein [Verrucomicrobiota bacterium]